MRCSRRRLFPRVAVAVLILVSLTAVDWEAPAGAIGLDAEARACIFPREKAVSRSADARMDVTSCAEPGEPMGISVGVWSPRGPAQVNATIDAGDLPVSDRGGLRTGVGPGWTALGTASVVPASGDHIVRLTVRARMAEDDRVALLTDTIVLHVGPHCSWAYRPAHVDSGNPQCDDKL